MNALVALAEEEEAILAVVASLTGPMEAKHERLVGLGVYARYRVVFSRYVRLLPDPSLGAEALKRALFLSWYDLSEPAWFTGVFELPSGDRHLALEVLNSTVSRSPADGELHWMVPYYYHLTEFAFPNLNAYAELAVFLRRAAPESYLAAGLESHQFDSRGQMGRYWQSILTSHTYRPRI